VVEEAPPVVEEAYPVEEDLQGEALLVEEASLLNSNHKYKLRCNHRQLMVR
jgi:hypothetical protein